MKKVKLIVGIIGLICMAGFSFGAELKILPQAGSVGKNCIHNFDLYMTLDEGEQTLGADVILDSNMEFVNFENAGLFPYYIPPRKISTVNSFVFLGVGGNNIVSGGLIGTFYYKVVSDGDQYIKFYFNGEGDTSDTNVAIYGMDILKNVNEGKFNVVDSLVCDEYTGEIYDESKFHDMHDIVINSLDKEYNNIVWNYKYLWIISGLSLIILIAILLLLVLKKGKRI